MIDSERRESRIRVPVRGKGITSLQTPPPRFLRVIYEGGRAYPREDFDWNVYLTGLIAPPSLPEAPGDRVGTRI